MLTRDFTCSRNRSQEFVAVVIAREKCAKGFTGVHTPYTAFPQARLLCNAASEAAFARRFTNNLQKHADFCTGSIQIVLRIIPLLLRFFIRPLELVDT